MGRAKRLRQQVHTDGTNGMSAKTLRLTWIAAAILAASPAMGLQPLEAFIAAAREQNPDAQRARANLAEQNAQADVSLGRQLPGVSVQASYLRWSRHWSLRGPRGRQRFRSLRSYLGTRGPDHGFRATRARRRPTAEPAHGEFSFYRNKPRRGPNRCSFEN